MNRRDFLSKGGLFLGVAGRGSERFFFSQGGNSKLEGVNSRLEAISEHVSIYRDVINVGVIRKNGKTLLIDSGDASILHQATALGLGSIDRVLYTHYHRDQCSGAARLKESGVKIDVPASEAQFFDHATDFWLSSNNILNDRMDFRPEMMVLRESVVTDRGIQPGDAWNWEGIPIRAVATPGHTDGSLTYLVEVDGKAIAFSGDLISGPGQIWEFYSLQKGFPGMSKDYWGFGGAVAQLLQSANSLLTYEPILLLPSHGEVIHNPTDAVAALKVKLDGIMDNYCYISAWRIYAQMGNANFKKGDTASPLPLIPPLPLVTLPSWLHKVEGADTSYCIIAEDKSAFLFDCGFCDVVPALDRMVKSGKMSRVDAIWATHYHDDHTTSINAMRQKYGSEVYIQKELQDIFENPMAYSMPALFTEGIHIDHVLTEGEVIHWKGYTMTAYYFPGQTLYHDGLLIEHEGTKVFMSGDSFANWGIDDYCSYNRNFLGKDGEIAGYNRCLKLLMEVKPDMLCAAHWGPVTVSQEYLQKTLDALRDREKMLAALFAWDDANFGLDPYWIRAYPYRQSILPGQQVTLEARIYNHSDSPRTASVELRAPAGWQIGDSAATTIPGHTEGKLRLTAVAAERPPLRRQVLGLVVRFDNRNLGEFTEAIVDYLT